MKQRAKFLAFVLILCLGFGLSLGAVKVQVKQAPATRTPIDSGAVMYQAYCANCHGANAKGDGPAAKVLTATPPDLTRLAQPGAGFPEERILETILGNGFVLRGVTQVMPSWGAVFQALDSDQAIRTIRVHHLVDYLATLQVYGSAAARQASTAGR